MRAAIVLDAGPLGMVSNPRGKAINSACIAWLDALVAAPVSVFIPEIADYEVRRELMRAGKVEGVARLDDLKRFIGYLPITTEAMLKAAEFWASARRQGRPFTDDRSLDGDVILAAQALALREGSTPLIATTNPGHLLQFADARDWRQIRAPRP